MIKLKWKYDQEIVERCLTLLSIAIAAMVLPITCQNISRSLDIRAEVKRLP